MLTNYHTHHDRCLHAEGSIEDYIKEAAKQNYTEIGMSCHVPFKDFPEMGTRRMLYTDLEVYLKDIEVAQKKYPQLQVLKGLECEYFPQEHKYMAQLAKKTDYLILGQHYITLDGKYMDAFNFTQPRQVLAYVESIEEALATGLFKILAHPDVFMALYPQWDTACEEAAQRLAQAALKHDVYLEVNANGFRRGIRRYKDGKRYPYPSVKFWEVVANQFPETKVLVNSDCHEPSHLNDMYMEKARELAKSLNLNVCQRL